MKNSNRQLKRLINKINATKAPSKREERRLTASVRSYDMGDPPIAIDPYLEGIVNRSKTKWWADDPKAKPKRKRKLTVGEKVRRAVKARNENDERMRVKMIEHVSKPIRNVRPIPEPLPFIMAPTLPPMKDGKPNIVALIYAFRAFQQFSHAFTRRNLGDPVSRELYYQGLKAKFREAMKDLGMEAMFDWEDF